MNSVSTKKQKTCLSQITSYLWNCWHKDSALNEQAHVSLVRAKKKKNPKKLFCAQLSACTELTINYPVYLRDTAHSQFISLLKNLRNTAFFLCSWLLTIEWQLLRESRNPLVLECYKARNRQKSAIKTTEKLLCTLEKYCLMEPWSVATLGWHW